ncbi:major facilitator superfamily transporter [Naviculisporaceae sp. PSN 640]
MVERASWLSRWTRKGGRSTKPGERLPGNKQAGELQDGLELPQISPQNKLFKTIEVNEIRAFLIWASIVCAAICPFLDEGIVATAIPEITNDFKSLHHIGWYGSAYLMTMSGFQLIFGQLYNKFSEKSIFLISLTVFEIGSVICATSRSSVIFIVGRAISGVGSAGLSSGVFALFALALPASRLPIYVGAMGAVYGISAVLGPVLGGVITNSPLTWRWCFYINLPISIPPMIAIIFFIHSPSQVTGRGSLSTKTLAKLKELDYLGMTFLIPSMSCFVTALEFGGSHGWNNGLTIGLLASSGLLSVCFAVSQWWMDEKALLPPRIALNRMVWSCALYSICQESAFLILVYFMPTWFQVIQNTSAGEAGVRYLALCIPFAISILSSGWMVSKCGYVQPFMLGGAILVSVATGLLSTLQPSSGPKSWIIFQIIAGIGIGISTDQPGIAVQSLLEGGDAPLGVATILFFQNLGPTIGLSAASSILMGRLAQDIPRVFPNLDPKAIVGSGAKELAKLVSPEDIPVLTQLYNNALTRVFILACAFAGASIVGIVGFGKARIRYDKADDHSRLEHNGEG